jgi:tungstate transport system permease protein
MESIGDGVQQALRLLLSGDREIIGITLRSLQVSGLATLISIALGLPLGTLLALGRFQGGNILISLVNTGMALPPVVVGLALSLVLWRSGPLGDLRLIYTPTAMVLAQTIIATPIVGGLTAAALEPLVPRLPVQLLALGASRSQMLVALWREARLPLLAAAMAGFGRAISEVGASLMVGGNLLHRTRVLTTATVLETGKGNFAQAIALGVILLLLAYLVNLAFTLVQLRGRRR